LQQIAWLQFVADEIRIGGDRAPTRSIDIVRSPMARFIENTATFRSALAAFIVEGCRV
jgi:hypothetical protein